MDRGGDVGNDHYHPLLEPLLQQLRQLAGEAGFNPNEAVDLDKARSILQVTEGDLTIAAQLYWEDFLATHGSSRLLHHRHQQEENDEDQPQRAFAAAAGEGDRAVVPNAARIRRRLEQDFNRQAASAAAAAGEDDNNNANLRPVLPAEAAAAADNMDEVIHPDNGSGVARILVQAQEAFRRARGEQLPAQDNVNNDIPNNVAGLAARAAALLAARRRRELQQGGNESVSVSDDESAGAWKVAAAAGGMAAAASLANSNNHQEGINRDNNASAQQPPKRKIHKKGHSVKRAKLETKKKMDDFEEEGYLSDNDWLWESLVSRTSIPLCTPFDLLWGLPLSSTSSSAAVPAAPGDGEGNVIADDDGEDELTSERSGIPRAWLNAGFALCEDGTGLVLAPPSEDDIAFFAWQQQAGISNKTAPPPPFHCAALTAVLSIVTGLLYTGAALQTGVITCSTHRKPFAELTKDERKREFEARLADILASLLHVAATMSRKRKERALRALKANKDPVSKRKWQKLEGKLRLCPTCWWETDSNGDIRFPVGRDTDRDLQVATSYTNIEDLRAYVLSNMRSFTARGGCALFLETILRIHGKGAVMRMIERSRRAVDLPAATEKSLINCNCEDRHKSLKVNAQQLRQRSKTRELMEALPTDRNCASVELVSLLLTGHAYSTWLGWSTGPLGLGLLSKGGKVGKGLMRPEKPVWVLCGETMYSVLWMNGGYENPEVFAQADQPDSVVELTHFCCWPGQRNTTTFRLAPYQPIWRVPAVSRGSSVYAGGRPSTLELILQRRQPDSSLVSQDESDSSDPINANLVVGAEDIARVHSNPDDEKFYPEKYRLWRYHIARERDDADMDIETNVAPIITEWVPFHRLTERQKLLVETKFGPSINTVLWTRWPQAKIDGFNPETPSPVV